MGKEVAGLVCSKYSIWGLSSVFIQGHFLGRMGEEETESELE
jgi:hypothetical protein